MLKGKARFNDDCRPPFASVQTVISEDCVIGESKTMVRFQVGFADEGDIDIMLMEVEAKEGSLFTESVSVPVHDAEMTSDGGHLPWDVIKNVCRDFHECGELLYGVLGLA